MTAETARPRRWGSGFRLIAEARGHRRRKPGRLLAPMQVKSWDRVPPRSWAERRAGLVGAEPGDVAEKPRRLGHRG